MEYRLDELFDLQMGKTPSRNNPEYWDSEDHKWISIGDLSKCGKYICETREYLSDKAVAESGISQIPANTVIMSFKLSIGKTAITPEPMYSNEAIMSFRDKRVVPLLPDYIFYMFSGRDWDAGTNKAVMGKTLNKATLSQIKIRVHSLPEQQKIVRVLDKAAAIIEARQKELQKLDELVKARFVEMFGDYIKEGGKPLSELATITGGLTKNSKRNTFDLKMPYLRVANVFFNRLDLNEILEIGIREEEIEKTLLQTGDLLFVEGNGSIEQIGRVAIWDGSISPILHQNHLIKARFRGRTITPEFALYYFMSQEGRQQIISKSVSTSGLNTLSVNKIGSLILPMPPVALQEQFAEFVKQTDKSKVVVQKALDEAQTLFDSLMQQYFG